MNNSYNLERFLTAQRSTYELALAEIKRGRKTSHWMWFIFPQIRGLGLSETSKMFAIGDIGEAGAFLNHEILGARLIEITTELLRSNNTDAAVIFGYPDDLKLLSCMTLFAAVEGSNPVFQKVINKFFEGKSDQKTLAILAEDRV